MIPSTSDVFAKHYLNKADGDSLVKWAEQMLVAGFDSSHLNILVGEFPPYNGFDLRDILTNIHQELSLPDFENKQEAVATVATNVINYALDDDIRYSSALYSLYALYKECDQTLMLGKFSDLYFGHLDLKDLGFSLHWNGLTKKNFQPIVKEEFENWLSTNLLVKWRPFEWKKREAGFNIVCPKK